ncbi:MAG TPA: PEP-CTERM sorting domain-containing protein [Isosphaeraceae bacterium]|nr:PEP-CTERM sorting domain-containing protein [Isosphaeraceae bacterium]
MNRQGCLATAIVAAWALAGGAAARADFGEFTYATQVTPGVALPASSSLGAPGTTIDFDGIGNGIPSKSPINNAGAPGGTEIKVATFALWGQGLYGDLDHFDTPVTVKLTITDLASGQSGSLTFQGTQTGSVILSANGGGTIEFNNPMFSPASQSLTLGNAVYTVAAVPTIDFGLPGLPTAGGAGTSGSYLFAVQAQDPSGGHGGKAVPEPASLALLGLGAAAVLARRARRSLAA